ncbi:MAG: hypothetical protein QXS42_05420 [Zestosphaera sp.]
MQRVVRSVKEARELFSELSNTLGCGESAKVMITNVTEIQRYVELVIRSGLSLVDVEEVGGNYYLVIVNRFAGRCG